jgi:hypothetical protein
VGGVRGFLEGSDSPSISLMALLSQSPGVCVPTTCYSLCSSEMEEQAVQTKNRSERRNLSRQTVSHGGPAISVLCAEKMSNHASSAPPLSGWLA